MKAKSNNEFIAESKLIHGDKYGYAETEYINSYTKVRILCFQHGAFFQLPSNHLKGRGCSSCAKLIRGASRRTSIEKFIERAQSKHANDYDYSHVFFKTLEDKILIICKLHGEFYQAASQHLQGVGCSACGRIKAAKTKTLTIDEFIEQARKAHGDKYDYSKTVYKTKHLKIIITCPKHGDFIQKAANHINGHGCKSCMVESLRVRFAMTQDDFLGRIKKIYGSTLKYEDILYINYHQKVSLTCLEHGPFNQYPLNLLKGGGCPTCGKNRTQALLKLPIGEFISRANEMHVNKYSYEEVSYKNLRESVKIHCSKHGSFEQTAYSHLSGVGCPKCNSSKGEREIIKWLNEKKVESIYQWIEHDCIINVLPAKFDFYIPSIKTIIEFDGEQHFLPVRFRKALSVEEAQERLEEQQITDFIKNDWAEKGGYKMLRIKYDENIYHALNEHISPLLLLN